VFEDEPVTEHPLFGLSNVVVTPHLGAATHEAQDKAGIAIAEMVRLALKGEFVPYAVNVAATEISEHVRPFLPLSEKLGRILIGLADAPIRAVEVAYLGRVADSDTKVLTLAVLRGVLSEVVDEPVSYVNAPLIARERGLEVSERRSTESQDYVNLVLLRARTEAGEVTVAGTLVGKRDAERLVRVGEFDIDMAPAQHLAFFRYEDRPGVIGAVGTILGEAGINVASMEVARTEAGGLALMGLTVDSPIPADVLERIVSAVGMKSARSIALPA
jgi:D-3-phosphoglycerate dehydrogenase